MNKPVTATTESDEPQPTIARARRLRLITIAAIALIAGLTLITTTQTWWTLHLANQSIAIAGSVAGQALTALSLCGLALAAALSIAGPVFRFILGLLQLLLGFTVVFTTAIALASPAGPSESAISKATAIDGAAATAALIKSVTETPWGFVAIALGILTFLAGVWLLLTFRAWPVASRKYQAVRLTAAGGPRDAVVDWDAQTSGADPTDEPNPGSAIPVK